MHSKPTGIKDRSGKDIFVSDTVRRYGGGFLGKDSELLFIGQVVSTVGGYKVEYDAQVGTHSEKRYGNMFNESELEIVPTSEEL